jgi:hypothetical protein
MAAMIVAVLSQRAADVRVASTAYAGLPVTVVDNIEGAVDLVLSVSDMRVNRLPVNVPADCYEHVVRDTVAGEADLHDELRHILALWLLRRGASAPQVSRAPYIDTALHVKTGSSHELISHLMSMREMEYQATACNRRHQQARTRAAQTARDDIFNAIWPAGEAQHASSDDHAC